MPARLIRMIEGDLPNGLVGAAGSLRSMSGSLLAGRLWWRTGFSAGCSHRMILHILRVDPPQGLPLIIPKHHRGITAATVLQENDSTEVQWSLPGDTIVPVLNVTSRVFWLELDDKALLDSYEVLQEGILCEVFSQKCSAAWQEARGERLTVGVMLPGRQDPGD